jgi:hypothetical protein
LLWGLGYRVTLTQKTHDGGKDIVAIDLRTGSPSLFVECKRRRPGKRVGVAAVRELVGAASNPGERVMKGLLVTSGHFTHAARAYAEKNCRRVELRTIDDIRVWMAFVWRSLAKECHASVFGHPRMTIGSSRWRAYRFCGTSLR